ncbi:MAG: cupin domain-containing protein [Halobacteriota archaeon]
MERVSIDDLPNAVQPSAVMKHLTKPLGTTDLAINYYELEPGDSFAFAYHRHEIQEEVFVVLSGTATFDTADGPVAVGPHEAVRFGPGEWQRGWNRGEERVVAIALGAPLAYGEMPKRRECPRCESVTQSELERRDDDEAPGGTAVVAICLDCGAETGRWYRGSMPGTVP